MVKANSEKINAQLNKLISAMHRIILSKLFTYADFRYLPNQIHVVDDALYDEMKKKDVIAAHLLVTA